MEVVSSSTMMIGHVMVLQDVSWVSVELLQILSLLMDGIRSLGLMQFDSMVGHSVSFVLLVSWP
jgi:hypothetical protein